jgi:hypothetical protein
MLKLSSMRFPGKQCDGLVGLAVRGPGILSDEQHEARAPKMVLVRASEVCYLRGTCVAYFGAVFGARVELQTGPGRCG